MKNRDEYCCFLPFSFWFTDHLKCELGQSLAEGLDLLKYVSVTNWVLLTENKLTVDNELWTNFSYYEVILLPHWESSQSNAVFLYH